MRPAVTRPPGKHATGQALAVLPAVRSTGPLERALGLSIKDRHWQAQFEVVDRGSATSGTTLICRSQVT